MLYPSIPILEYSHLSALLQDDMKQDISPFTPWNSIMLLSLFGVDINILLAIAPGSTLVNILFLSPTESPEKKIALTQQTMKVLADNDRLSQDLNPMIINIHNTLPRDPQILSDFARSVMQPNTAFVDLQKEIFVKQPDSLGISEFILAMTAREIPDDDKQREIVKPLYEWAAHNLDRISDIHRSTIIQSILKIKLPADGKGRALAQPLYEWVIRNLEQVKPIQVYNVIKSILSINIPSDEMGLKLARSLYEWIIKTLTQTEDFAFRRDTMNDIFAMKLPSDEHGLAVRKLLFDMIIQKISSIDEQNKTMVMYAIINMPVPTTAKNLVAITDLYQWVLND